MSDLPFLKSRRVATALMAKTKPDSSIEMQSDDNEGLMTAAEDLISAIHMKDAKKAAEALQAAFEMMDSKEDESGDNADFLSQDDK